MHKYISLHAKYIIIKLSLSLNYYNVIQYIS